MRLLSALSRRDLQREVIVSHELVHFLQHQAFPAWMDPDPYWKSQGDAASALQAALEGDALHYGFASLEIEPPDVEELRSAMDEENATRSHGALAEAPALLRLTVTFPYAYGYGLSLQEGRALLAAPPASTEQVLHPEKRHEPFQAIHLAGVRAALPAGCAIDFRGHARASSASRCCCAISTRTGPPRPGKAGTAIAGSRRAATGDASSCGSRPGIRRRTRTSSRRPTRGSRRAWRSAPACRIRRSRGSRAATS